MVLVPPIHDHLSLEVLGEIQKRRIPAVTAFRDIPATGWPFIRTDVYHNKFTAAKHLCDIGCQRIAFIGYEEHDDLRYVKHYAFLRALLTAGKDVSKAEYLLLPEQPVNVSKDVANEVDAWIERWLNEHPDVDGISCSHDEIAYSVLRILRKLGRNVPDEVAVTGEGNFGPYFGFDLDALTTVDLRFTEMAEKICSFLRAMRDGEPVGHNVKVAVKGDLIRGRSTMRGGTAPTPNSAS
jgi:DNA-binding LacI/PurR family transcriptional regulator